MSELALELKELIIETLNLEDVSVDDIEDEAPLFGDGLGLDSIDALELGVALQKKYAVKVKSDAEENREFFYSIKTLEKFVSESVKA